MPALVISPLTGSRPHWAGGLLFGASNWATREWSLLCSTLCVQIFFFLSQLGPNWNHQSNEFMFSRKEDVEKLTLSQACLVKSHRTVFSFQHLFQLSLFFFKLKIISSPNWFFSRALYNISYFRGYPIGPGYIAQIVSANRGENGKEIPRWIM